jgi:hypothetical protein
MWFVSFVFFFLTEFGYCLFSNVVFSAGWLRFFAAAVRLFSLRCILLYSKTENNTTLQNRQYPTSAKKKK